MTQETRFDKLEALLAWGLDRPQRYFLLREGLRVGLRTGHPSRLTLGDCAAFITTVQEILDYYGFEEPSQALVDLWLGRLADDGKLLAAYRDHAYVEQVFPVVQGQMLTAVCDRRGVPRDRVAAIFLGNLFHFIWHVAAGGGQLEKWYERLAQVG